MAKTNRGVGIRSNIILDDIDLTILKSLEKKSRGVLELTGMLKLEHRTVKLHLERLSKMDLVNIKTLPRNKKEISLTDDGWIAKRKFLDNAKLIDLLIDKSKKAKPLEIKQK